LFAPPCGFSQENALRRRNGALALYESGTVAFELRRSMLDLHVPPL
jgi:hypothetical protein